jgi:ABC-type uncharacterized transport system substrate-binding protein
MRRRDFLALTGAAVALPRVALGQQAQVKRLGIAFSLSQSDPQAARYLTAVKAALARQGWIEGKNLVILTRWSSSSADITGLNADQLIALGPDILLTIGTDNSVELAKRTDTIPIVFSLVADAVGAGLVDDLGRPARNVTGLANLDDAIGGKWVQLLKEFSPGTEQVWYLVEADSHGGGALFEPLAAAADRLGLSARQIAVRNAEEIFSAIEIVASGAGNGLIVSSDPLLLSSRMQLVGEIAEIRLPTIWSHVLYAVEGGIVTYAVNPYAEVAAAGVYAGRILNGVRVADLPVQPPRVHTLSVNLKTARAQGFEIPPTILARADEVIE